MNDRIKGYADFISGQIDELSKKTLGSYIKKNVDQQTDLTYQHGSDPEEYETNPENPRKIQNRSAGLDRAVKKLTKEESESIVNAFANFISKQVKENTIFEESDDVTVKDGEHQVTLHRMQSDDSGSTFTVHHPDGTKKKAKITFDKHGDGEEIHHAKVNKAFGLPDTHKIGKKIANGMNGMGGYSKFED